MKFNNLDVTSSPKTKRVGRGIAAGQGKTAGRGTKGQNARTGGTRRPGFEGGQSPLTQRLPKLRGFTSKRVKAENIFVDQLDAYGVLIDNHVLFEGNVISSPYVRVKLLSRGEVKKKHSVKLQGASKTAIEQIQKAGGDFQLTAQVARTKREASEKL